MPLPDLTALPTTGPERLRAIRLELGLSQAGLAEALGLGDRQQVAKWERGATEPSRHVLALLLLLAGRHPAAVLQPRHPCQRRLSPPLADQPAGGAHDARSP